MDYKEFIDNNGNMVGKIVWICDYRHNDVAQKPIRHIKPTPALVVSNDDLPKGKTVYYSDIHFNPIGKKGTPLKQIIAPYDNTGYRSYTGVSLNIFLSKEECIDCYVNQSEIIKKEIEVERERSNKRFDGMVEEVNKIILELKDI